MKKTILTIIALTLMSFKDVSVETIKFMESSNREHVIGDNNKSYGILQIQQGVIDDVNRVFKTSYVIEDALEESCSEEIFYYYLSYGIKLYKEKHGKLPTEEQIVRMWNGGIYKGYKYKSTIKYAKKYFKLKNKNKTNE